ncbi:hypothetical protein NAT51_10470 [Flavobacterium amniphilum]|uniref:hypothetical protein n=1 Tax=Flavobacterium amniphilum TaxID=1834035 RepID=UPI00202A285B|nr:hypothetical protein [Flavobacterium amniphilum]MCL9805949.1 hypothetical protein [Flavobacterium amniphilum]
MIRVLILNRKPILTVFKFFLVVFGFLSIILLTIAYFHQNTFPLKYAIGFTFATAAFCTFSTFFLEYLRTVKENNLFKKKPYDSIEELTLKIEFFQDSKYHFFKKHRFIKLEQNNYEIIFYSDILRNEFGNVLVIIKEAKEKQEAVFHLIDYKRQKFNKSTLFDELKKI